VLGCCALKICSFVAKLLLSWGIQTTKNRHKIKDLVCKILCASCPRCVVPVSVCLNMHTVESAYNCILRHLNASVFHVNVHLTEVLNYK